jgi:LacI family transcriptional regulator
VNNVTIKDIAKELSLHFSTVSRALNNHPNVSPETRAEVLALAKKWNYHPNSLAKSFKNRKMSTLGVIVPRIDRSFFASMISGMEEVAYRNNYTVIVSQSNEDVEQEVKLTHALANLRVAGMIVSVSATTVDDAHFRALLRRNIPLLFVDRVCEDVGVSKVVTDDYAGAFQAVEYLIKKGYRRIAHLAGPDNLSNCKERTRGYRDALEQHGLVFDESFVIKGGFGWESGIVGLKKLLDLDIHPDAIFTVGIHVAFGAFQEARRMNLKIPEDFALIGFGDDPFAAITSPPLTAVAQDARQLGKRAVELLLQQIDGGSDRIDPVVEKIKPMFIVRGSA